MTIRWNASTGRASADLRGAAFGRLHIALRTKKQGEAAKRYAALCAFVAAATPAELDQLRRRKITVEAITRAHGEQRPFSTLAQTIAWPTLGEAVELYLAAIAANPKRAKATHQHAKSYLTGALSFFGPDVRLDEITSDQTDAFRGWLIKSGGRNGTGLQPQSAELHVQRVTALYNWIGKQEGRQARHQKRAARLLHVPVDPENVLRDKPVRTRFLNREEGARLLAATPSDLRAMVCLGLYAGLRANETLHLRPMDVDLETMTLYVREKPLADGSSWRPKSRTSRRELPIGTPLAAALRGHLEAGRHSDAWLFPSATLPGWPISDDMMAFQFKRVVENAGLVYGHAEQIGITYHTLRHSFASQLVMAGVDLFTIARLLGHANTKIVESTYGHLAPDHKRRAVDRLDTVFQTPGGEA